MLLTGLFALLSGIAGLFAIRNQKLGRRISQLEEDKKN